MKTIFALLATFALIAFVGCEKKHDHKPGDNCQPAHKHTPGDGHNHK